MAGLSGAWRFRQIFARASLLVLKYRYTSVLHCGNTNTRTKGHGVLSLASFALAVLHQLPRTKHLHPSV